jgi:hypothetical protein
MSHALSHAVSPAGACNLSPLEAQKLNCVSWGGVYSCLAAVHLSYFYQERASSIMYSYYTVYIYCTGPEIFSIHSLREYTVYISSFSGRSINGNVGKLVSRPVIVRFPGRPKTTISFLPLAISFPEKMIFRRFFPNQHRILLRRISLKFE